MYTNFKKYRKVFQEQKHYIWKRNERWQLRQLQIV